MPRTRRDQDRNEKQRLSAAATTLAEALRGLSLPRVKWLPIHEPIYWAAPHGWWIEFGRWRGFSVGLSLDDALKPYLNPRSRTYWYGFWSSQDARIIALAEAVKPTYRPRIFVDKSSVKELSVGLAGLRYPVRETLKPEAYFGIYDCKPLSPVPVFSVKRACNFIAETVLSFERTIAAPKKKRSAGSSLEPYTRCTSPHEEKIFPAHRRLQDRFEAYLADHANRFSDIRTDDACVDIQFRMDRELVIAEIKPSNTRSEVRQAIGQLYDYEQDFGDRTIRLLIVLGHPPNDWDKRLALSNRCGIAYPNGKAAFTFHWPE